MAKRLSPNERQEQKIVTPSLNSKAHLGKYVALGT